MILNPNWSLWTVASINKHFKEAFASENILVELAGQRITTSKKHQAKEWLEIRVDGPWYKPVQGYIDSKLEVNILISVIDGNSYRIRELAGKVSSAMYNNIAFYEIDNGLFTNRISCMSLSDDRNEKIQTSYFGIVHAGTDIEQLSVETHYEMKLS